MPRYFQLPPDLPLKAPPTPPPPARPAELDPEPAKFPGPRAPAPAGLDDVVWVLPNATDEPVLVGLSVGLTNELARQALWLAAREDFGLRPGDAALADPPDRLPPDRLLRVRGPHRVANTQGWAVDLGRPGTAHTLWEGTTLRGRVLSSTQLAEVESADGLSRGLFAKCLAAAGFEPRPAPRSDAPVPPAAERWLRRMRETGQFAAVRILHAEVRAKGESPALLGALSRAYANLGLLTEFHWTAAPEAFKARGLLYAQRLVTRDPKSAAARWHRAYAAALAGFHVLALDDLKAAAELARADGSAAPDWVEPIDAYVHFDLGRLDAARRKGDTPLARLLRFLAVEFPEAPAATIRAGRELLAAHPECYRVHDAMCRTGGVSHLHGATLAGPAVFARHFPDRVREQPGLPDAVGGLLDAEQPDEARVYAALARAGDPAADREEPSWAVLRNLLREVRFTQSWHRLEFLAQKLAVPAGDEAREAAAALAGHPLLPLIESFEFDPVRDPDAVRARLTAAPVRDLDLRAMGYYHRLSRVDQAAATAWYNRAAGNNGSGYAGEVRQVLVLAPQARGAGWVLGLEATSPHAPLTAALKVARGRPEDAARYAEFEARYAGHAVVLRALAERHRADGRTADAVRCATRWAEVSPDLEAYRELAAAHLAGGDEAKWLEALEAYLEQEDTGLGHARVRVDLAEHFMAKGDFKRAEPYALAAAESGAGWAILCAARCEEGLRRWGTADEFYRAAARRYGDPAFEWYFACRATGKMDRAAAERAVREFLAGAGGPLPPGLSFYAGRFYVLTGDPARAVPHFARANELTPTDLTVLFGALAADAAGDAAARDRALATAGKLAGDRPLKPVAEVLRGWFAAGRVPDRAAVDAELGRLPAGVRPDAEFFVGWYLANRGERDRAIGHWERCATAEAGSRAARTHAKASLEESATKGGTKPGGPDR